MKRLISISLLIFINIISIIWKFIRYLLYFIIILYLFPLILTIIAGDVDNTIDILLKFISLVLFSLLIEILINLIFPILKEKLMNFSC
ncbi:Uncharacterised protein [Phocoenobacter uteri]|uniref:Uncharacterized protein n=1 Tax=Phocoenobacter uteri TaxID=146806 RepID=A0A379DEL1_9PAST|nr:hypothetical protein [Phocoenobacter uteri]SUB76416.1 Uncharacterised protein [Phocoenobacter uteri]